MASDRDLVSTQDHELNYLLRKWNKKQSQDNRVLLADHVKKFKGLKKYTPHNRENFYKYIDEKAIKKKLEK